MEKKKYEVSRWKNAGTAFFEDGGIVHSFMCEKCKSGEMESCMQYLLGIDGGGTGTKITVADLDEVVLAQMSAGALNGNGQSSDQLRDNIKELANTLKTQGYQPKDCKGLGAGVAGISNQAARELVKKTFAEEGFGCFIALYGDHETALAAAFPQNCGVVLIAGTGSICYARRSDGTCLRVGGYGHIVDDGGSAYAIGRDILAAVVRQEDGRGTDTILRRLVFQTLHIAEIRELIGYIYHPERSKKDIAALAVLLDPAISQGDTAASAIEDACIESLAELALTAIKRLDEDKNLAFGGSVLLKNSRIRNRLQQRLQEFDPQIQIIETKQDASIGALRLLIEERKQFKESIFKNENKREQN